MRADLDAALAGNGRVVLLGGEPGIGKTRLASVLAADAESRGVPVWWGRGWEDGSAPPFWPWNTALRGWIDRAGDELVAAAAGSWIAELAHVFPVLRDRLPEAEPNGNWDSDRARFRLFDSVGRFLAGVAGPAGLVIVLDDVHWADHPSLKLLEYVAGDMRGMRLLIVATYRDTEVQRDTPFFATLSRLIRESSTRRIFVAGLSAAHCAQWVAPLLGARTDSAALGEALHRETNGNPFFLGEIVHLLASEGSWESWEARRVPHGVREVIVQRLQRLGDECRDPLAVAALLGDPFELRTLREILGQDEVADRLQHAADDRILIEVEEQPGHYGFANALIRRVLADELKPSVRASWHARIAAVLEHHAATSEAVASELVRHFAGADTPEGLRKAFDHACAGAERAARGLGWEEAVRLYEVALDVGERSGAVDAERAIELRLALARALRGAGDVAAARACCEEVMVACRRTPRPVLLARAALIHAGPLPEFGRVDPTSRAVLEEAYLGASALDDGMRARLSARLAGDLIAASEVEQGERVLTLCDEAADAARRAGDSGALAMALTGTYYAVALRMRPRGGTANYPVPSLQEILEAAEAGGEYDFAAAVRHLRAATLFALGEAEAFSAEVDGLATLAIATRAPEALWLADALGAMRAAVQGRFVEAHDLAERALSIGRRMQLPNAVGQHMSQRIMLQLLQGRLPEMATELEAFVESHPGGAGWRPLCAIVDLARGDTVAARAEFEALLAVGLRPAESGVMSRCYLAGLALLCIELGDRARAPMLYGQVARQREEWIIDGCQTLGPWALLLAGLALLCDRPADAVRHYEHAIALARRMRALPFVAQAQVLLATHQLATALDDEARTRAADMLAEAQRTGRELGLLQVTERVAALNAQLTERRSASLNVFRRDGDVWTVRYQDREVRLKDGKGPRYLATMLAAPGREFHVLELANTAAPASTATVDAADGLSIGGLGGSLDDAPDARARREYRTRLNELQAEIDEADRFCDQGRAERLRAELDVLVSQLTQQFRSRPHLRGPAETARKAVTKVLRTQVGKLLDVHPLLGQHLRDSLRMGTVCVYAPATTTTWDVAFD